MPPEGVAAVPSPSVVVIPPEGGRPISAFGSTAVFKLSGHDTGGALCLAVAETPPGAGPPPHVHARDDELFFVLHGELSFLTPDGWVPAPQGAAIFAPKGIPHTFRNAGSTPSRHLVVALPSGFEEFYQRCAEVFSQGGPPNREQLVSIAADYGYEFLPPR
jgi:mannose-6-phosphate isomerase-like protein (cupin superfamily)